MVKKLTENLKDKYHHVFFDNYFTSFRLLEELEKTESMGVVQHAKTGGSFQLH